MNVYNSQVYAHAESNSGKNNTKHSIWVSHALNDDIFVMVYSFRMVHTKQWFSASLGTPAG